MCPGARRAEREFARLVSQLDSLLYLERFLVEGFPSLPARLKRRYPDLRCWHGIAGLRQGFARFLAQPPDLPVSFFGQSHSMIHFAGECLFGQSKKVLTTDLEWPAYINALKWLAGQHGAQLHVAPLRDMFFRTQLSSVGVVQLLQWHYGNASCDGIFLSDISYLGMRFPLKQFLDSIPPSQSPFIVIDGAQALNHRPIDLSNLGCDLYLTGTQKWFQSYHPLRIALAGREQNRSFIDHVRKRLMESSTATDPLFAFCDEIESRLFSTSGETVNIAGLISAAGSLWQHQRQDRRLSYKWQSLVSNAQLLASWLAGSPWRPICHADSLQSGILLLHARSHVPVDDAQQARTMLNRFGIAATVLSGRTIRLSMPSMPLALNHITLIIRAVHHLARGGSEHTIDRLPIIHRRKLCAKKQMQVDVS